MDTRRNRKMIANAFPEFGRRELGFSRPGRFARRLSASEVRVAQMNLYASLEGHQGCVNTVEFNSTGDALVSGSDDGRIIFWNWSTKTKVFSSIVGHTENIFQAKIMPCSDDRRIVTSCAGGEVRLFQVLENNYSSTRLGKHEGSVHKLAVEPGSPHVLYSSGEDGFVQRFDLRTSSGTNLFQCSHLTDTNRQRQNNIRLYDIVIDPRNPNHFAVGASDQYARVYDMRSYRRDASCNLDKPMNLFCPPHLIEADVHITGLTYSNSSELLISYNDELIYLFQKNMGMGPTLESSSSLFRGLHSPQVYMGHRNARTVKGANFIGPNSEYVVSGSDCGHIFIWKKKGGKLVRMVKGDKDIVNQVEPHPHLPFLASCGFEPKVNVWIPMENDGHPLPENAEKIMETNKQGREDYFRVTLSPDVIMHILQLRSRQESLFTERRLDLSEVDFEETNVVAHALQLLGDVPSAEPNSPAALAHQNCCIC